MNSIDRYQIGPRSIAEPKPRIRSPFAPDVVATTNRSGSVDWAWPCSRPIGPSSSGISSWWSRRR